MKKILTAFYTTFCLFLCGFAQPGTIDPTFKTGTGTDNTVKGLALQPDGKIIVAGNFTTYIGTTCNRIARLNANGSLDADFNPGKGSEIAVGVITLQPDGKILIGGGFTDINGSASNHIARLNADGSLDQTFNQCKGANNTVYAIALQPDKKIIAGGSFTSFNGSVSNHIIRLNADGSTDNTFLTGTGTDNYVEDIALQPDGKIIVSGAFVNYNGIFSKHITRLNTDGSRDTTFIIGKGADGPVSEIVLQPDGKIIISGWFSTYNSTECSAIARINTDGSPDKSFNTGAGSNLQIIALALQPDGKIIIGGGFNRFNYTDCKHIGRLNADGSLDATFTGTGTDGFVNTLALQPDGKIIIGGNFTTYNDTAHNRIARIQGK